MDLINKSNWRDIINEEVNIDIPEVISEIDMKMNTIKKKDPRKWEVIWMDLKCYLQDGA